jgi:hypothetical protein
MEKVGKYGYSLDGGPVHDPRVRNKKKTVGPHDVVKAWLNGAGNNEEALRLAHEYAQCFAEYRSRTGYRPFSVRQRFDGMTDEEVLRALDEAKGAIARPVEVSCDVSP